MATSATSSTTPTVTSSTSPAPPFECNNPHCSSLEDLKKKIVVCLDEKKPHWRSRLRCYRQQVKNLSRWLQNNAGEQKCVRCGFGGDKIVKAVDSVDEIIDASSKLSSRFQSPHGGPSGEDSAVEEEPARSSSGRILKKKRGLHRK